MRYSVVSCPRCGRSRVADNNSKTTGCPSCGRRFELAKANRHFDTDSQEQARLALAAVNSGDSEVIRKLGNPAEELGEANALKSIGDPQERASAVAKLLTSAHGDFSRDQFDELAGKAGMKNPGKALESAVDGGWVFEPRPGRYRAL